MQFALRLRKLMPVILLVGLGIPLAGCATGKQFATLTGPDGKGGGACDGFPRPEYQVRGVTEYDQKWADKVTEAGVAGCAWKRPGVRPASLDAKPMVVKAPPAKPVKNHWYDRFKKRVTK